jgi:hypothetical protein
VAHEEMDASRNWNLFLKEERLHARDAVRERKAGS